MNYKVLVVGPGSKTKGGITTVINAYYNTSVWNKWNCTWIETYRNSSIFSKIFFFFKGFILFLINLPFSTIVHFHISWSTTVIRKLPFFLLAYILRKKIIIHLHSGADAIINGKNQFAYRIVFSKADCVIVLANAIEKQLNQEYRFKRIEVLYNPCPKIDLIKNRVKSNTILFAGTLNEEKGFLDLIESFSKISKKRPDWNVLFAGNGEIEKGIIKAKKLGIKNQVIFTGWITGNEKEKYFKESSIFCLPSYSEGFPMAILEAVSYGLPVITTPVGGITDVFIDGINAMIFLPGDINSLAEKIDELIDDIKFRNELVNSSFNLAKTTFNIDTIANNLNSIYCSLTNKS